MADIAELGFRVDSSGLVRAAGDIDRLNRAASAAASNRVRIDADVSGVDAALREIERLAVNRSIRIDANATGISEALRDLDRLSGGARSVRIDVGISGVEAAVRGLRDIERLAVNRAVRIDIDTGDIGRAISDLERLAQQARDAASEINGLGANVNVTSGAFGGLGGVLSTVLSGGALAIATTEMIEQARQLTVLSNAYDVSANSIQTWQAASKPLGIEADKIGDIFKDVSDKIGDFATTGGGEAKDMFEKLGLSIEEFKSLKPDEAILKIGASLDKSNLTKSQKIFLLEGLADDASLLLPLLENNAAALKKVSDNAAIQASFMTDADIATMNQAGVSLQQIKMAAGGVTTQLGLIGAGMLVAFGDDITAAIGGFVSLMQSVATEWAFFVDNLQFSDDTAFVVLREIGGMFASIGDAIAPVTPYLTEFGIAFAATGVALAVGSAALTAAGAAFALLTSPITLTVAAIAGLIVAGKALYENWDLVTAKFGEFTDWWNDTTFDQKILDIETTALETAESLSTAFFDWWDNSALKPIALEIQAAAIDYAQQVAQAFGAWWDSWTLREVAADVTADLLIWAWEKSQAFAAWWDSWHLMPKEGSVDTSLIEKAWGYVQSFVDWWNSISLKDLASGAMSALNSVKNFGSDIIDGLSDGISRATSHITAAKKAAGEVESTMRKALDTHSPSRVTAKIGGDVVDGLAQGIDKNSTKAEKSAAKLAERTAKAANDAYFNAMAGLDDEYAKLTLSTEGYERYKLKVDGVVGAKQDEIIARKKAVDALDKESKAQKKAADDLVSVFEDAIMQGKNLFDGLHGWIENLFAELVLKPTLQPIADAAMSGGDVKGAAMSGLNKMWGDIKAGGMQGAMTSAGIAGGIVGLLGGSAGQQMGASIGAGIGNILLPGLGGIIGGALGTLAGGFLDDDDSQRAAFTGGNPKDGWRTGGGRNLYTTSKLGTFGFQEDGTHDWGAEGEKKLQAFVKQMAAVDNALVKFLPKAEIDRIKADLSNFKFEGTDFDKLFVERLKIISSGFEDSFAALIDFGASADEVLQRINDLVVMQQRLVPALSAMNLQIGMTAEQSLAAAAGLADAAGGLSQLQSAVDYYMTNFYSETERQTIATKTATATLAQWNNTLGLSGAAAIDTKEEFRAYVESLDLTTAAGQEAYVTAMTYADAIVALTGTMAAGMETSRAWDDYLKNGTPVALAGYTKSAGAALEFNSLPKYASGTDYVQGDQAALIHSGEMIFNRGQADSLRSNVVDITAAIAKRDAERDSSNETMAALLAETRALRAEVVQLRNDSNQYNAVAISQRSELNSDQRKLVKRVGYTDTSLTGGYA